MGTHPIFESDFDCLTECRTGKKIRRRKKRFRRRTDVSAAASRDITGYDCSQHNGMSNAPEKRKAKGKAFEPTHTCYECGKSGHYAYDCVRRLTRERSGQYKKGEMPRGRASPTYDDYKGDRPIRRRSRSRSPKPKPKPPAESGMKLKRKSKNVQNIRSLWQL